MSVLTDSLGAGHGKCLDRPEGGLGLGGRVSAQVSYVGSVALSEV